ncbi:hypothetical protein PIB30_081684 [Stylosanthes scabra]|uniref:Uncharacterized protein n=1 Tax=Stylosanthes scabra TaxID=79078 RepID=A0ABU6TRA5_9FABA|nr:hypothetical protein [Stylosanthes scabra]
MRRVGLGYGQWWQRRWLMGEMVEMMMEVEVGSGDMMTAVASGGVGVSVFVTRDRNGYPWGGYPLPPPALELTVAGEEKHAGEGDNAVEKRDALEKRRPSEKKMPMPPRREMHAVRSLPSRREELSAAVLCRVAEI